MTAPQPVRNYYSHSGIADSLCTVIDYMACNLYFEGTDVMDCRDVAETFTLMIFEGL